MIETALARALALDPADSEALALNAMIAFRFGYDWPEAERQFRNALRLSPHASSINYRYGFCLIVNGRFDEGLKHLRAAVDLDPLNLGTRASAAHLLAYTGDLENAEAEAHAVLNLEPDHLFTNTSLGLIHLYGGRYDVARERFERVIALDPGYTFADFGRIAALGFDGRREQGVAELMALLGRLEGRHYPRYGLAVAWLGLGDRAEAYRTLERAAIEGDPTFCSVGGDPLFARCRTDPAFVALLTRHGLVRG